MEVSICTRAVVRLAYCARCRNFERRRLESGAVSRGRCWSEVAWNNRVTSILTAQLPSYLKSALSPAGHESRATSPEILPKSK